MSRRIVLLVDDDVVGVAIRSLIYQEQGYVALTTFCGEEAIALCEHLPLHLVILDVEMPGMGGLEVATRIRALRPSVPIVMLSGCAEVAWQGVADAYVQKGFLTRNGYPHRLLEPTAERFANAESDGSSAHEYLLPAIIFAHGRVLHRPTIADLSDELGLTPAALQAVSAPAS